MHSEPSSAAASTAPLYSQVTFDDRGNYLYQGDLQRPGESLAAIVARLEPHLRVSFPNARFAILTQSFSGIVRAHDKCEKRFGLIEKSIDEISTSQSSLKSSYEEL